MKMCVPTDTVAIDVFPKFQLGIPVYLIINALSSRLQLKDALKATAKEQ